MSGEALVNSGLNAFLCKGYFTDCAGPPRKFLIVMDHLVSAWDLTVDPTPELPADVKMGVRMRDGATYLLCESFFG